MMSLIAAVAGRPWAVRSDLALHVRGLVAQHGLAGLRHLAELKGAAHATDVHMARPARGQATGGGLVQVIPIIGTLTQRGDTINSAETRSTASVAAEVLEAAGDPKIDAIVLEVDSGGGEVYGVPEAWSAIRAAGKVKPVVAVANSQAASAALYLASAARELWVTPSGEAGSVGVYALHVDASAALAEAGEKWTFIAADDSPNKVEGNPAEPLTDEAAAQIRKSVNRYMGMFVRDLARGRGVSEQRVLKSFGGGRMLGPQEAVDAKMADAVGTLDQAIRRAAELAQEGRSARPAGRASSVVVPASQEPLLRVQAGLQAGPVEAPNLREGATAQACLNCEYYSKPSADHDGGVCSRHDFHAMDMWACDDWEAKGEPEADEPAEPMEPGDMSGRAAAAALLRVL